MRFDFSFSLKCSNTQFGTKHSLNLGLKQLIVDTVTLKHSQFKIQLLHVKRAYDIYYAHVRSKTMHSLFALSHKSYTLNYLMLHRFEIQSSLERSRMAFIMSSRGCSLAIRRLRFVWENRSCHAQQPRFTMTHSDEKLSGAPKDNFLKNICSEEDLRSRIFETFVVKFLACLPLLGFSNI